jgi:hypothetical protein
LVILLLTIHVATLAVCVALLSVPPIVTRSRRFLSAAAVGAGFPGVATSLIATPSRLALSDPHHRILSAKPEKTLFGLLKHLDCELLPICDPQFGHRRFHREIDRPRPYL